MFSNQLVFWKKKWDVSVKPRSRKAGALEAWKRCRFHWLEWMFSAPRNLKKLPPKVVTEPVPPKQDTDDEEKWPGSMQLCHALGLEIDVQVTYGQLVVGQVKAHEHLHQGKLQRLVMGKSAKEVEANLQRKASAPGLQIKSYLWQDWM